MTTRTEPCHDCGNDAVAVQASSCDLETGYVDAMALCGPCYAARNGEVDLTPLLDAISAVED